MQTIRFLLLSFPCLVWGMTNACNEYEDVLISLFEHFPIQRCFILKDFKLSETITRSYVKRFSRKGIATAVLNYKAFSEIAKGKFGIYSNTAVVMHLSNESQVDRLVEYTQLITEISLIWIVLVQGGVETFTYRIYIPIYCQFLMVESSGDKIIKVHEFYNIRDFRKESLWGTWSTKAKLTRKSNGSLITRRRNFNEATLTGSLYIGQNAWLQYAFWFELQDFYNFTSVVVAVEDIERTGARPDALLIDLGMSSRTYYKDAVMPLGTARYYLFMKRPTEEKFWKSYIRPFTRNAWSVILLFTLVFCLLIPFIKTTVLKNRVQTAYQKFDPVAYGCLAVDTMLSQNGMDLPSMTASLRIAFFVTICFAALLQCLYSSDLISYLMTQEPQLPFLDVAGLVKDGSYNVTFRKGRLGSELLLRVHGPVVGNYVRSHYTEFASYMELPRKLCSERLVFAGNTRVIYNPNLFWPCKIFKAPQLLETVHSVLFLRQNSDYMSPFKFLLLKERETGILKRIQRDYYREVVNYYGHPDLTEVDLPRIFPPLVLLLLGFSSSLFILLLESLLLLTI